MFKFLAIINFALSTTLAFYPIHPAYNHFANGYHPVITAPIGINNLQNNHFGQLGFQHTQPLNHNIASHAPIFYGPVVAPHALAVSHPYVYHGAIGNPYLPIRTNLNTRKLNINNYPRTNLTAGAIKTNNQKAYRPVYNVSRPLVQRRNAITPFVRPRTAVFVPKKVNTMPLTPGYNNFRPIGHVVPQIQSNFRPSYINRSVRPLRFLKQKRRRTARKLNLKVDKKAEQMNPEDVTKALNSQIANMRKLISSMDETKTKELNFNDLNENSSVKNQKTENLTDNDLKGLDLSNKKKNVFRDF